MNPNTRGSRSPHAPACRPVAMPSYAHPERDSIPARRDHVSKRRSTLTSISLDDPEWNAFRWELGPDPEHGEHFQEGGCDE